MDLNWPFCFFTLGSLCPTLHPCYGNTACFRQLGVSFLRMCCHALIDNILVMTRTFSSHSVSWSDGSVSNHVLHLYHRRWF